MYWPDMISTFWLKLTNLYLYLRAADVKHVLKSICNQKLKIILENHSSNVNSRLCECVFVFLKTVEFAGFTIIFRQTFLLFVITFFYYIIIIIAPHARTCLYSCHKFLSTFYAKCACARLPRRIQQSLLKSWSGRKKNRKEKKTSVGHTFLEMGWCEWIDIFLLGLMSVV